MTSAYRIEQVSFRYKESPVLEIGRLDIASGEIVALAGPNGAGKTTLLHILAFVESPNSGQVYFFNEKSMKNNIVSFRRRVGLLIQNPYLFHTTVLKNITWGLRLRGCSRTVARQKAMGALKRVGLSGFEHRNARTLSGGETQRVALARALVLKPDVLLLDEPANHMDRESIDRTFETVVEMNNKYGITIVITTHDISRIQHMVHRVIHLQLGTIVTSLPENLFSGQLVQNGSVFQTDKISVILPTPLHEGCRIAIDPQKIKISSSLCRSTAPNSFRGRVASLSSDNGLASIHIDAGERFHIVTDADESTIGHLHLGQIVSITLQPDGISVF